MQPTRQTAETTEIEALSCPVESMDGAETGQSDATGAMTRRGSLRLRLEFSRRRIDLTIGEPVARIGNNLGLVPILRHPNRIMCLAVLNLRQRLLLFVSVPRIMRSIVCQDTSPLCRKGNSVDSIPFQGGWGYRCPTIVQSAVGAALRTPKQQSAILLATFNVRIRQSIRNEL